MPGSRWSGRVRNRSARPPALRTPKVAWPLQQSPIPRCWSRESDRLKEYELEVIRDTADQLHRRLLESRNIGPDGREHR